MQFTVLGFICHCVQSTRQRFWLRRGVIASIKVWAPPLGQHCHHQVPQTYLTLMMPIQALPVMPCAGQFLRLHCKSSSCWEWHPFTIASIDPGVCLNGEDGCDGGSIVIHLKAVGPWTQKLGRIAEQQLQQQEQKGQQKQQHEQQQKQQQTRPGCHVIDVVQSKEAHEAVGDSQSLLALPPTLQDVPHLQQHWPAHLDGLRHPQATSSCSSLPKLASFHPHPPPMLPGNPQDLGPLGGPMSSSKAHARPMSPSCKPQLGDQPDQLSLIPMEIEGPYGDCLASLGKGSQVIVLVAGGLGITPMAAIQRELLWQQQQQQQQQQQRLQEDSLEELNCSTFELFPSETSPLTASTRIPQTSSVPFPPQIHMVWAVRAAQAEQLLPLFQLQMQQAVDMGHHVHVHLTGGPSGVQHHARHEARGRGSMEMAGCCSFSVNAGQEEGEGRECDHGHGEGPSVSGDRQQACCSYSAIASQEEGEGGGVGHGDGPSKSVERQQACCSFPGIAGRKEGKGGVGGHGDGPSITVVRQRADMRLVQGMMQQCCPTEHIQQTAAEGTPQQQRGQNAAEGAGCSRGCRLLQTPQTPAETAGCSRDCSRNWKLQQQRGQNAAEGAPQQQGFSEDLGCEEPSAACMCASSVTGTCGGEGCLGQREDMHAQVDGSSQRSQRLSGDLSNFGKNKESNSGSIRGRGCSRGGRMPSTSLPNNPSVLPHTSIDPAILKQQKKEVHLDATWATTSSKGWGGLLWWLALAAAAASAALGGHWMGRQLCSFSALTPMSELLGQAQPSVTPAAEQKLHACQCAVQQLSTRSCRVCDTTGDIAHVSQTPCCPIGVCFLCARGLPVLLAWLACATAAAAVAGVHAGWWRPRPQHYYRALDPATQQLQWLPCRSLIHAAQHQMHRSGAFAAPDAQTWSNRGTRCTDLEYSQRQMHRSGVFAAHPRPETHTQGAVQRMGWQGYANPHRAHLSRSSMPFLSNTSSSNSESKEPNQQPPSPSTAGSAAAAAAAAPTLLPTTHEAPPGAAEAAATVVSSSCHALPACVHAGIPSQQQLCNVSTQATEAASTNRQFPGEGPQPPRNLHRGCPDQGASCPFTPLVHYGKPDLNVHLTRALSVASGGKIAVLGCGPNSLLQDLKSCFVKSVLQRSPSSTLKLCELSS